MENMQKWAEQAISPVVPGNRKHLQMVLVQSHVLTGVVGRLWKLAAPMDLKVTFRDIWRLCCGDTILA
jgi:hypothetical protein